MSMPLAVAKYLQPGRVDDEMERAFVTPGKVWDLNTTMTSGKCRMVGRLERKAHQAKQRSDEAFGLAQRQMGHRSQGQRGYDRQIGVPALSPWMAAE